MLANQGSVVMRRWQDEQHVDPAVLTVALDRRVTLRMQLSLDLLEPPDSAFDLAEHDKPPRLQAGIDRAPARQRRLRLTLHPDPTMRTRRSTIRA
jgi:hypothetical protein